MHEHSRWTGVLRNKASRQVFRTKRLNDLQLDVKPAKQVIFPPLKSAFVSVSKTADRSGIVEFFALVTVFVMLVAANLATRRYVRVNTIAC